MGRATRMYTCLTGTFGFLATGLRTVQETTMSTGHSGFAAAVWGLYRVRCNSHNSVRSVAMPSVRQIVPAVLFLLSLSQSVASSGAPPSKEAHRERPELLSMVVALSNLSAWTGKKVTMLGVAEATREGAALFCSRWHFNTRDAQCALGATFADQRVADAFSKWPGKVVRVFGHVEAWPSDTSPAFGGAITITSVELASLQD